MKEIKELEKNGKAHRFSENKALIKQVDEIMKYQGILNKIVEDLSDMKDSFIKLKFIDTEDDKDLSELSEKFNQ